MQVVAVGQHLILGLVMEPLVQEVLA